MASCSPKHAPAALVALLKSPDSQTRLTAAWALSEIGDSTALPAIRQALEVSGETPQVTRALLRAMVHSGATQDAMSSFLESANPELRLHAIKSLTGGGEIDTWPWPWPRVIPFP